MNNSTMSALRRHFIFCALSLMFINFNSAHADNIIDETLLCHGTEPFWSMKVDTSTWQEGANAPQERLAYQLQFSVAGDDSSTVTLKDKDMSLSTSTNDRSIFQISSENMTSFFDYRDSLETRCNDGMSDLEYPYSVYVKMGSITLSGCCESGLYPAKMPK